MTPLNSDRGCIMAERNLLVPFEELNQLEIFCKNCGTGIVFDFAGKSVSFPSTCPACPAKFNGGNLPITLQTYQQLYRELSESPTLMAQFRIKETGGKSEKKT